MTVLDIRSVVIVMVGVIVVAGMIGRAIASRLDQSHASARETDDLIREARIAAAEVRLSAGSLYALGFTRDDRGLQAELERIRLGGEDR